MRWRDGLDNGIDNGIDTVYLAYIRAGAGHALVAAGRAGPARPTRPPGRMPKNKTRTESKKSAKRWGRE
ncbi:hypothetical protein [Streptosporangium sp. NPDC049644]|uniref:hypothetical protein n=1 Tax=Streptosporangium sp. NPDC049644 TaxID=3155507 RepID=UPI0034465EF9